MEQEKKIQHQSETAPSPQSQALEILQDLIQTQIQTKDQMIDRLHQVLEQNNQDAYQRFTDQLLKAIAVVHKGGYRLMISAQWSSYDAQTLRQRYEYLIEDLEYLLEQQNVDCYISEPGSLFDSRVQTPVLEPTKEEHLHRTIKESLSPGYRMGSRVLIPERVLVYQFEKTEYAQGGKKD